jgi:hypothetical protein
MVLYTIGERIAESLKFRSLLLSALSAISAVETL